VTAAQQGCGHVGYGRAQALESGGLILLHQVSEPFVEDRPSSSLSMLIHECQTVTATPAEPGDLPDGLDRAPRDITGRLDQCAVSAISSTEYSGESSPCVD
jgi:hypothetical protein